MEIIQKYANREREKWNQYARTSAYIHGPITINPWWFSVSEKDAGMCQHINVKTEQQIRADKNCYKMVIMTSKFLVFFVKMFSQNNNSKIGRILRAGSDELDESESGLLYSVLVQLNFNLSKNEKT